MDSKRFGNWTRDRARRLSRRDALRIMGAGSAAVALQSLASTTLAQPGGSCTYEVSLTSSLDTGSTVSGILVIDIGEGGAIDTGSLSLSGQAQASVVGQATGPAIDLLASLDGGSILALSGVANTDIAACAAAILGSLANADAEQIGTWTATPGTPAPSGVPVQPPPAEPTSTPTPFSAPVTSICDPPRMICGQNCCPAGADCLDTGACECPSGTEECGIACFPSCADGATALDPVTCLCPTG